jgi:hypothetical protein
MADPIIDTATQYYTTFPDDVGEWAHLPFPETTKLELMQRALDRGAQVTREEVDAVHVRLLGLPMATAIMAPPPEPEPPPVVDPPVEPEARREPEPEPPRMVGGRRRE